MPADMFLKIEGIDGESSDDAHSDWIEVLSYSHGVSQQASATASSSGGGTVQRADFQDLSIVKELDKASPKLSLKCAAGEHIPTIKLELCRSGGDKLIYMEYELSEVIVSSISVGGGGGGVPTESVTFNYSKIKWNYIQQKRADGAGGGNIPASWSLALNKEV
jgi:type VI secretion system secreted protein Hcp